MNRKDIKVARMQKEIYKFLISAFSELNLRVQIKDLELSSSMQNLKIIIENDQNTLKMLKNHSLNLSFKMKSYFKLSKAIYLSFVIDAHKERIEKVEKLLEKIQKDI